jgi:hypothetical protein
MSSFNNQNMCEMADEIIKILATCNQNKETWKKEKYAMIRLIQAEHPTFYESYTRVCRILVLEENIEPLLAMMKTFANVQNGELSLDKANEVITKGLNSKYVDPVLNSDSLVKERERKIREEKDKKPNSKIQVIE